jgi:ankyrin repeat protein
MNLRLLNLLGSKEEIYPHMLEEKFPRVFNMLLDLWETKGIDAYLQDLLLNSRDGGREGFPPDAVSEIFKLISYYNDFHELDRKIDVWGPDNEKIRKETEQLGYAFTTSGFLKSVEDGNHIVAKRLISCGVHLEVRDENNWTALMMACSKGMDEFGLLIIKLGAKVGVRDTQGYTPLHWAAYNGHTNTVNMLLEQGADPNAKSLFGWTALMQAASRGHLITCAYLIADGANIDMKSNDGNTALHKASQNGHVQVVTLLLNKGADRNAQMKDGCTPLDFAERSGRYAIVSLLNQS